MPDRAERVLGPKGNTLGRGQERPKDNVQLTIEAVDGVQSGIVDAVYRGGIIKDDPVGNTSTNDYLGSDTRQELDFALKPIIKEWRDRVVEAANRRRASGGQSSE